MADGRVAGAILENDFLLRCLDRGIEVHLLTPGARFQPFVERYQQDGVSFSYLSAGEALKPGSRALRLLRRVASRLEVVGLKRAEHLLWRLFGEKIAAKHSGNLGKLIEQERPDAVVACNVSIGFDAGLIAKARTLGIPTLGNIFSWDHPFRVQKAWPEHYTCWSAKVREWMVEQCRVPFEKIEIIGAPAFDPYLTPDGKWPREELAGRLGLEASRPIIVFATLGQHRQMIDETAPFRTLMKALDAGQIPGRPQVILRLHPVSVDYYFEEYRNHPDVVFSRFTRSCPGMRWWPSREEVTLAGNILRHTDVCLSPGSTMAIEPSIFDTPTLVPVFNPYTTQEFQEFFDVHWMNKHFRFLRDRNLLPFAFSQDEMVEAVNRFLRDPSWMAEGRDIIRRELLGPLDGKATQRLVDVIDKVSNTA